MKRCIYCVGIIWPWQRMGWYVLEDHTVRWHPDCLRKAGVR